MKPLERVDNQLINNSNNQQAPKTQLAPSSLSLFERLENARVDSQEMIESMSKLSQFFEKYSRDKRVKIEEGWLRIKEESVQMLYRRCRQIEQKLRLVGAGFEGIFEELSIANEEITIQKENINAQLIVTQKDNINLTKDKEKALISKDEIAQSARIIKRGWQLNIDQIDMRSRQIHEKTQNNAFKYATQLEEMQKEFECSSQAIDNILLAARNKQKANKELHGNCEIPHLKDLIQHNNITNNNINHSLSMTMPPLFDRISPITKNTHLKDRNIKQALAKAVDNGDNITKINGKVSMFNVGGGQQQQQQHQTNYLNNSKQIKHDENHNNSHQNASESFESGYSSHMSTSKNEGRWESGFESPSQAREQQCNLKKAIVFLADHMELLQAVKNLSNCERSGHIELLMHHVQTKLKEDNDGDEIRPVQESDNTLKEQLPSNGAHMVDAFKKKNTSKDAFLHSLLADQIKRTSPEDDKSRPGKDNSILDLVQSDEMSFRSRLPPLTSRSDQSENEPEFKNHIMQEDLLRVKLLDDQMYFIKEEDDQNQNSSSNASGNCSSSISNGTHQNFLFPNDEEELLQHEKAKLDAAALLEEATQEFK